MPIKQIDVIVFPFYLNGYELATPVGERKFRQWMINLNSALKSRDTAFVIIHHDEQQIKNMRPAVREKFIEFQKIVKRLREKHLAVAVDKNKSYLAGAAAFKDFSTYGFEKSVLIRYYGQHVGTRAGETAHLKLCVEDTGASISKNIGEKLKLGGVNSVCKQSSGLSIKNYSFYLETVSGGRLFYPTYGNFLRMLSEGKRPGDPSLFSIRPKRPYLKPPKPRK